MITRGAESVSKSVTIGAVSSVETNWSLVENFDFYPPGPLSDGGIWIDMYSDTTHVVQPAGCNRLAKVAAASGAGGAAMLLNDLTVTAGQARTLFFRMTMPAGSPAAALTQFLGVSDRVASFPYQWLSQYNAGPLTFPLWDSSNWWLGVSTNLSAWISTNEPSLMADSVYNVWVDITNVTMVNAFGSRIEPDESDIFSVHIQKEGDAGRTTLFSDVFSNRALNTQDEFSAHQPDDNINRVVMGNSVALEGVLFDDIYLSKSGYSATVPRAAGYAGLEPSLRIEWSGSLWQVVFEGTLEEASAVDGTWSEVSGATSPHPVSTTGEQKFYRAVCD
jgi:hypothetical protein